VSLSFISRRNFDAPARDREGEPDIGAHHRQRRQRDPDIELPDMIALKIRSWKKVGKMLNSAKDSSVSMPLVPRSMTRDRPPVLRSR
jgi:hypothetical protein